MDCRALRECDLRGQVGGAAEAVDAQPTAAGSAARRSARQPMISVQQRCRALVIKAGRHRIGVRLLDDGELRVAAVGTPSGGRRFRAGVFPPFAAPPAAGVGAPQPRHADPIAEREPLRTGAEFVDEPDDLMPRDDLGRAGGIALGEMQIGATDTAGPHRDPDLPRAGLRIWALPDLQRRTGNRSGRLHPPAVHDRIRLGRPRFVTSHPVAADCEPTA